jgi:Ca2+-transporting ATPase
MLLGQRLPLLAVHLLLVNAITGFVPAMALGLEKPDKASMSRPPLPRDESIFARGLGAAVITQGVLLGLLTLTGYFIGLNVTVSQAVPPSWEVGVTMAFLVMAGSQLVQAFNCKRGAFSVLRGLFGNKALNLAVLGSLAVILIVSLSPPLAGLFSLTGISANHWAIAAGLMLMPLPVLEITKAFSSRHRRNIR